MTMSANLRALSGYGLYMLQYVRDAICLLMMWAGRDVVATTLTQADSCTVLAGQAPSHLLHVVYILMRACPLGRPWPLLFRRSSFIRVGVWLSCRGRFPFSWSFVVASFRAFLPSRWPGYCFTFFACNLRHSPSVNYTPLHCGQFQVARATGGVPPLGRPCLLFVVMFLLIVTECLQMFARLAS